MLYFIYTGNGLDKEKKRERSKRKKQPQQKEEEEETAKNQKLARLEHVALLYAEEHECNAILEKELNMLQEKDLKT